MSQTIRIEGHTYFCDYEMNGGNKGLWQFIYIENVILEAIAGNIHPLSFLGFSI
ncbi:MAG: hypothetical protein WBA93_37435 [Microcoleaceae cyanobacterium]